MEIINKSFKDYYYYDDRYYLKYTPFKIDPNKEKCYMAIINYKNDQIIDCPEPIKMFKGILIEEKKSKIISFNSDDDDDNNYTFWKFWLIKHNDKFYIISLCDNNIICIEYISYYDIYSYIL